MENVKVDTGAVEKANRKSTSSGEILLERAET